MNAPLLVTIAVALGCFEKKEVKTIKTNRSAFVYQGSSKKNHGR